jgi:uncharacterized repeat protein (TIGR01451 family)
MKKLYLLISVLFYFFGQNILSAQNLNATYDTYQHYDSVYVPITGGILLGSTSNDDGTFVTPTNPLQVSTWGTGAGFPIGFNFLFQDTMVDVIGINCNGWISFGKSSNGMQAIHVSNNSMIPISVNSVAPPPASRRYRASALGTDLQAQANSTLRIQTLGNSPNRVCVIQWSNYRIWQMPSTNFSFQIRLYETSNMIEFAYGSFTGGSGVAEVGLGGINNQDFINRTTATNWNNSVQGTLPASKMYLGGSVTPPSANLRFVFAPIGTFQTDIKAIAITEPIPFSCGGPNQTAKVKLQNMGSLPHNFTSNPVSISLNVNGPISGNYNLVVPTGTPDLSVGAIEEFVISSSIDLSLNGVYQFLLQTSTLGDLNPSNNNINNPYQLEVYHHPANTNYYNDFSGSQPVSISSYNLLGTNVNWGFMTSGTLSNPSLVPQTPGVAIFNSYSYPSGSMARLLLPCMDFSATSDPSLNITFSQSSNYTSTTEGLKIRVSTDGGITFGPEIAFCSNYYSLAGSTGWWKDTTISLCAYGNMSNIRIAIDAISGFGDNIFIDEIGVNMDGGCPEASGFIWLDLNQNCIHESNEQYQYPGVSLMIQPGNIMTQTDQNGNWSIDGLNPGNYSVTVDTSQSNLILTCPPTINFTIVHVDSLVHVPPFGFFPANACSSPSISVNMPIIRRLMPTPINVNACNLFNASTSISPAYVDVTLDSFLVFTGASRPYTDLGNQVYRFDLDSLPVNSCVNFQIFAQADSLAVTGQSIRISAKLNEVDSCVYDTIPGPFPPFASGTCNSAWDHSSLSVSANCDGDSVHFLVINQGSGSMQCYAPYRVFNNNQLIILDSLLLNAGDSATFSFQGNNQTWRLETWQHPLHPGHSAPSASIERCGSGNWTPGFVNNFPVDDGNPDFDIFIGEVTGPFDPNDKKGLPEGAGPLHWIEKNQTMDYTIRFQNTGNDTAFTVVIRDTLSDFLDIFSVQTAVTSHPYSFRIYGPRVLEWTFNNIQLPDSNVNEPGSHGFIQFSVEQIPELSPGTVIENKAGIYFDFEAPIITNTAFHTIHDFSMPIITKVKSGLSSGINVFPNPTHQVLYLELSEDHSHSAQLNITDLSGRNVISKSLSSLSRIMPVDVSALAAGSYILTFHDENGLSVVRFVKD